jgi:hypothetical protein
VTQPNENIAEQPSSKSEMLADAATLPEHTTNEISLDTTIYPEHADHIDAAHPENLTDISSPDEQPKLSPDNLIPQIATALCDALLRCCNQENITQYFTSYINNPNLTDLIDTLPPKTALNKKTCPATLSTVLEVVPFGDWVHAVKEGLVSFDANAAQQCLDHLYNASCGQAVRDALFDSTCFAFSPPFGGEQQRKAFKRTTTSGKCVIIRDGVGAGFYGSCDPTKAFCCYPDSTGNINNCSLPKTDASGLCKPVSQAHQDCSIIPPIQLCSTGFDCDPTKYQCLPPNNTPLQVGDACLDNNFNLLGNCQQSWCDLFNSKKCEPLKDDGKPCRAGYECKIESCEKNVCTASTFCSSS